MNKSIYQLPKASLMKITDFSEAKEFFMSDFREYYSQEQMESRYILCEPTLIGILCYRTARAFHEVDDDHSALVVSNLGRFFSGFELYYSAKIGHSLKINHGLSTVVGARSVLGNHVLLHHGITIGAIERKSPIIEDNVVVYPGAKILGGITIGANSVIGANAIVIENIKPGSTIVSQLGRLL